jgi:hypothetical protein
MKSKFIKTTLLDFLNESNNIRLDLSDKDSVISWLENGEGPENL